MYISITTGEIQESITSIIRVVIENLLYYKFIDIRWKKIEL